MRRQLGVYFLALSFMLVLSVKAPAGEPTFATFDPPGAIYSEANDINPRGEIVGRYYDGAVCNILNACTNFDGHNHGYLLSGARFTTIDPPGSIFTGAVGINPGGDIVGRYRTADGKDHGFLLSGGEFTSIDFPGPDVTATTAWGINPRGDIVGQYSSRADGRIHGYLLRGGDFTSIDFPAAILTNAWKINPAGDIVGRYLSADRRSHSFLLRGGEFTSIDFPDAFETATFAFVGINARGDIVSHYCDAPPCTPGSNGKVHGFLLTGGEFISIDFPDAFLTIAAAINARGDIVGLYKDIPAAPTCTISPSCGQGHSYLRSRGEGN